jgi:hypothetical protein
MRSNASNSKVEDFNRWLMGSPLSLKNWADIVWALLQYDLFDSYAGVGYDVYIGGSDSVLARSRPGWIGSSTSDLLYLRFPEVQRWNGRR